MRTLAYLHLIVCVNGVLTPGPGAHVVAAITATAVHVVPRN
jgi:hypothetical protein